MSERKISGVKLAVFMKRAKRLLSVAEKSIGMKKGFTADKLELKALLEQ